MTLGSHLVPGLAAIAGWHVYLWFRLVKATGRSLPWRVFGAVILFGLSLLIPLLYLYPPNLGPFGTRVFYTLAFGWMGVGILLLCSTLLTEPVRAALRFASRHRDPQDPGRRLTLGRVFAGVAMTLGLGTALAGAAEALALGVQRVRVPLRKLPASMSGTRIVQITDLHFGGFTGPAYLERVVAEVNALEPDLIAITGDLVDGTVIDLGIALEPLSRLKARHGVYFVTGNHEYYYGGDQWITFLQEMGIVVLTNERVAIGNANASFDLVGVPDRSAGYYGLGHAHDLARALEGRDPTREVVLLAHQPTSALEAAEYDVGLQISGHTHGGQIYPVRFLLYLEQPFIDGLHRLRDTFIYVSRGTGYWGPPIRVGAPPEITEITLVRQT
jgi:uncharacterized protein